MFPRTVIAFLKMIVILSSLEFPAGKKSSPYQGEAAAAGGAGGGGEERGVGVNELIYSL